MRDRAISLSLLAALASICFAAGAFAGPIDLYFKGTPSTSKASWAGGSSTMTASADRVAIGTPRGGPFPLADATISFISGAGESGSGTTGNPYIFAASAPETVLITGCLPGPAGSCSPVTLFAGEFQGREKAFWSGDRGHFDAGDVTGTMNPLLASYLGISTYNFVGELNAVIACSDTSRDVCRPGMSRILAGGDLVLYLGNGGRAPAPEPSALLLLGSGMCGVTLLLRRREKKRQRSLGANREREVTTTPAGAEEDAVRLR